MSHATTASPKPSLRAPWRVGDAVVGRGNVGWTTSKGRQLCPCWICSQGPLAEKTGRGSLLNRPSCPPPLPDGPNGQGTELKLPGPILVATTLERSSGLSSPGPTLLTITLDRYLGLSSLGPTLLTITSDRYLGLSSLGSTPMTKTLEQSVFGRAGR